MARLTTGERFNRLEDEWTGEHKSYRLHGHPQQTLRRKSNTKQSLTTAKMKIDHNKHCEQKGCKHHNSLHHRNEQSMS